MKAGKPTTPSGSGCVDVSLSCGTLHGSKKDFLERPIPLAKVKAQKGCSLGLLLGLLLGAVLCHPVGMSECCNFMILELLLGVLLGASLGCSGAVTGCSSRAMSWLFCWNARRSECRDVMVLSEECHVTCVRRSSTTAGQHSLCHTSVCSWKQGQSIDCDSITNDWCLVSSGAHKLHNIPHAKPRQKLKVSNICSS